MAATLVPALLNRRGQRQEVAHVHETDSSLALSCRIHADMRRLSQALTEAEYIEAWICFPHDGDDCSVAATQNKNAFQIECHSHGELPVRIIGVFLIRQERELLFSWETNRKGASQSRSFVNIRLQRSSSASFLELRHIGLASADELAWNQQLWSTSLSKLAFLLSSSCALPKP